MQLLSFPLESIDEDLPAIQLDDGTWLFSAQETCVFGEIASRVNAAKWVRTNIPAKWIVELKTKEGNGRPGLYLTKPGFYYAVCQGKSEKALRFRDEVFEVILPKIDASGYYISDAVTSKQLVEAQKKIEQLQIERGYLLEWSPRMSLQKMRFLELINFKAEEYSPFFLDVHDSHCYTDPYYWQKLQKYQKRTTIMFALIDTLLEPGKKVSVYTFGCKTLKGLLSKVPYKFYRVLTIPCNGIEQKLNPKYKHLEGSVEVKEEFDRVWLKYVPNKRKALKSFLNTSA